MWSATSAREGRRVTCTNWADALTLEQARAGARIERALRLDADRWARLEARNAERAEDELERALMAAPFCTGECA
jgi:hypothetical protein